MHDAEDICSGGGAGNGRKGGVGNGGQATLAVDGEKVVSEHLPQTIAYRRNG